jgi:hypothetical protein
LIRISIKAARAYETGRASRQEFKNERKKYENVRERINREEERDRRKQETKAP